MLIYIGNIISLGLWAFFCRTIKQFKQKDIYLWIFFFQFVLISGLRSQYIGIDTINYARSFSYYDNLSLKGIIENSDATEIGFKLLMWMISQLGGKFRIVLLLEAILLAYSICAFVKRNSTSYALSTFAFIGLGFFNISFNVSRQFVAISFILIGLNYAEKRELKKFLLCVIIACFFHATAMVGITLYFFFDYKNRRLSDFFSIFCLVFSLFSFMIAPVVYRIIPERYQIGYLGGLSREGSMLLMLYVLISVVLLTGTVMRPNSIGCNKYVIIGKFLVSVSVVFQSYVFYVATISRIVYYFSIPLFLLLPNWIEPFIKKKKLRRSVYGVAAIALMLFYVYMIFSSSLSGTVPYKSFAYD